MGEENKLVQLLNDVCNIVIAGEVQLPIIEGCHEKREIDSGEVYDQSIIVNILINGISPDKYINKISLLTRKCLSYLRTTYDSELNPNKNKRLIRDDIQLLNRGITHLSSRSRQINIANPDEARKIRIVRYNELQRLYFNHVVDKIVAKSLTLLSQELNIELNSAVHNFPSVQSPHQARKKKQEPVTFEDLFFNPANAERSIDILRELSLPVVDLKYNYIGKNKGVFCVWVNCLIIKGIMITCQNRIYTKILNEKVIGLGLGGSEFTQAYKIAETFRAEIESKLSVFC
jgi:hypothetical protein